MLPSLLVEPFDHTGSLQLFESGRHEIQILRFAPR